MGGIAGTIVHEFRGLFFSRTLHLKKKEEDLGCSSSLWCFKHQITFFLFFFKQTSSLLCLTEDCCWPLWDPETSCSKQIGVTCIRSKKWRGIPRSLQSIGQKSVLLIGCPHAAGNKLQTLSSCKHWSALACVGTMSCVFASRTRCAVEQDFGRTLVYVCCRNHRLKCHSTHTLHVHWQTVLVRNGFFPVFYLFIFLVFGSEPSRVQKKKNLLWLFFVNNQRKPPTSS